jgi:hypothetical protein
MADIENIWQDFKDAARALILLTLSEPANNKEHKSFNYIWLGSFKEALSYLVKTGLADTLRLIDKELTAEREVCLAFEQIMRFFSHNPAAQIAMPLSVSEESLAREILDAFVGETAFGENPLRGITSDVAAIELANCRRNLERLLLAREAVQRAIASEHR